MANARMEALLARRAPSLGSGSIRVLTPQNTGISSIAKRNAANESEVMINKYNNGLISNAEMKSFLQSQISSPYVSDSDKTDIQAKLQDFDVLIEKDRLESVFKLAQENTLQKEQAAQALAQFYTQRASTMVAGTPAHSQALENAGNWQATVTNIQQSVSKQQRSNYQDQLFQKINQFPTSSSERSIATAEAYKKLADMAASQGDVAAQNDYLAKYEQAQTYADQYKASEDQKQSLNEIKQFAADQDLAIAKLTDKTPEELKSKAEKAYAVAQKYLDIGDQLNYTKYMAMGTQAEEKYNKKVSSETASQKTSSWDVQDDEYKKEVLKKQQELTQGKINVEQYSGALANMLNVRNSDLKDRAEYIQSLDPNDKLKINGRNIRAEDLLIKYDTELTKSSGIGYGDKSEDGGIQSRLEDFASGNVQGVVQVAPSESGTNPNGSGIATFKFVNKDNLQKEIDSGNMVADTSGVYHQIQYGTRALNEYPFVPTGKTPEEQQASINSQIQSALAAGGIYDDNGNFVPVTHDKAGNPVYKDYSNQYVDTYEPGGTKKITIPIDPSKPEKFGAFSKEALLVQDQVHFEGAKSPQRLFSEKKTAAMKSALPQVPITPTKVVTPPGTTVNTPQPAVAQKAEIASQVPVNINSLNTDTPGLSIPKPVQQAPALSVPSNNQNTSYKAPAPTLSIDTSKAVTLPSPTQKNSGLTYNYTPTKVSTPTPTYNPIQTFQSNVQKAASTVGNIGTSIKNTATNVLNKLKWW